VYKKLLSCLRGDGAACEELGLCSDAAELLNRVAQSWPELDESALRGLARVLTFHVATTTYMRRGGRSRLIPAPRPFWSLKGKPEGLVPSFKGPSVSTEWIPCSQCGLEPAILLLRKQWPKERAHVAEVEADFNDCDVKRMLESAGLTELEASLPRFKEALRPHFKPGEALGPYCLLKRAVYISALSAGDGGGGRGVFFVSTDDVALEFYSSVIKRLLGRRAVEEISESLASKVGCDRELCRFAVERVLNAPRDVERALYALRIGLSASGARITLEEFIERFAESVIDSLRRRERSLEAIRDAVFEEFISSAYPDVSSFLNDIRRVSRLDMSPIKAMLAPRTRYAVVSADADNVGKLHSGHLSVNCKCYVKSLCSLIRSYGEASEDALRRVETSYARMCEVIRLIHGRGDVVLVSPTFKSALSLALVMTALKDVVTVRRLLRGMVIYAGGDDLVALAPVDTIANSLALRENYAGARFLHRLSDGTPIASAVPLGRSMSVRVVNLLDVMSEEIAKSSEVMEARAKRAEWRYGKPWIKDTLALSFSRSGAVAALPLSVMTDGQAMVLINSGVMLLLARIYASLAMQLLSKGLPEDFERSYGEAVRVAVDDPSAMRALAEYVVSRNIQVADRSLALKWGKRVLCADVTVNDLSVYDLLFSVVRVKDRAETCITPLFNEVLNAIRVLRVLP